VILGSACFLACGLTYSFFQPALGHGRWNLTQFDLILDLLGFVFVLPIIYFGLLFRSVRIVSNSTFAKYSNSKKILYIFGCALLWIWAFAPEGTAWQPAARKDIVRSCYKAESRDPEQCRKALEIAETVGTHLSRKGLVPVSQFLNNDEFINHYAERNHLTDPERAPATAQEPKSNP